MRKLLFYAILLASGLMSSCQPENSHPTAAEEIAPGVIKLSKGQIDKYTPYSDSVFGGKPVVETMKMLSAAELPFSIDEILCILERIWNFDQYGQIHDFPLRLESKDSDECAEYGRKQ